jgi:hypothetical protein
MGAPKVKTTVAFESSKYKRLKKIAQARHCEVRELIKESVEMRFDLLDKAQRQEAVKKIANLDLPVASWEEMENETIKGATES